jgi:hypothetical protein
MGSEFMSFVSLLLDGCQRNNRMGVMKSIWVVFCLLMVSGCETLNVVNNIKYNHKIVEESTRVQEEPKKASEINVEENIVQQSIPTLYDLTDPSNEIRPEELMVYRHTTGRIRVFQVIKEKGKDADDIDVTWVLARGEDMAIGIINDRGYVNGEYVQGGEYRYIGPLTYQTAPIIDGVEQKRTNTVRLFVEVGCEFDKVMQKQKKLSESNVE